MLLENERDRRYIASSSFNGLPRILRSTTAEPLRARVSTETGAPQYSVAYGNSIWEIPHQAMLSSPIIIRRKAEYLGFQHRMTRYHSELIRYVCPKSDDPS